MKIRWNHRYVQLGVTAFLVIAASILFYYGIFHMKSLITGIKTFFGIMAPIIYGAAIAYLLTPIVNFLERKIIFPIFEKWNKTLQKKGRKVVRWICVILSVFLMFLVIYALVMMILPQLIRSIMNIIYSFPHYVSVVENWLNSVVEKGWKLNPDMISQINQYSSRLQEYLTNTILPQMQFMMKNISASFLDLLVFLKNFLIGAIVSLYILADKEGFIAKAKMAVYAALPTKWATFLVHSMRFTHKTFGGFISGKILDSAIIGVLCYVGTSIIGTPYAILVSVIVGVTNVIPFFGPYLGAVPCILLILLVDPIQSLYFLIFILILQQFDGNILGPKILGESTGLSSFMVIVAIMVGGGLFGVPGMIVGVPVFAVLNAAVWKLIGRSLDEKDMSADAEFYRDIDCVDPVSGKVLPMPVKKNVSKAQEVTVKAEKNRIWSGAWDEIKRMFTFLVKFIQAKYVGFRLKQKKQTETEEEQVMKFVIQRVNHAEVKVDGEIVGKIGKGFLVLIGVGREDTREDADWYLKKLLGLRIFEDENGKTNLSLADVNGELLLVSQFTLYANCRKGNRPSFIEAGAPDEANKLYEYIISEASKQVPVVEHGIFGADMKVSLENDGPFTVIFDENLRK